MVESRRFRGFVELEAHKTHLWNDDFSKPANVPHRIPINPIPAWIIFLLGLILAGHHQTSMESTMMHSQVPPNSRITCTAWLTTTGRQPPHWSLRSPLHHLPPPEHLPSHFIIFITAAF